MNIGEAAILFPLFLEAGRRCASKEEMAEAIRSMGKDGEAPANMDGLVEFMNKMMI